MSASEGYRLSKAARDRLKSMKGTARSLAAENEATDQLLGQLDARQQGQTSRTGWQRDRHGWYQADGNRYPTDQKLFEEDLPRVIREWVLPGHAPSTPLLDQTMSVVTLGSCFARELRLYLDLSGVKSARFWIPSGLNNTFALVDFFSWCVTGEQTGRGYRYERSTEGEIREWTPEAEQAAYREALASAGAMVFTIGLAEVWEDRETGGVFWRGVPEDLFETGRHVFRLSTVEENTANLTRLVELIREVNPHAPIVMTLSPVPLVATFRPISCLTADCVSKSVLRVALDQLMAAGHAGVYYWPSFEIVKWVGANLPWPSYGAGGRARDVDRVVVSEIIRAFIETYYTPAAAAAMDTARET